MTRRLQNNLATVTEWAVVLFFLTFAIREFVLPRSPEKSLIGNFLNLSVKENSGFVFGIPLPMPVTLVITIIVLGIISWYYILSLPFTARKNLLSVGLGLIIGGGFANFFERITNGHVTDYLQISIGALSGSWNAADIGIIVGMILWIAAARKENTEMIETSHTVET